MTLRSLAWQDRAACNGMNVNDFFNAGPVPHDVRRVCYRCPVRVECGDFGRTQPFGIWGGKQNGTSAPGRFVTTLPAHGARRRLQALARDGYTPRHIAEMVSGLIGRQDHLGVERIRSGLRQRVTQELHDAIDDVWQRLAGVTCTRSFAGRVAELAASKGWPDRAAWHGIDIDDPKARAQ